MEKIRLEVMQDECPGETDARQLTELSDLELAYVGGGAGDVTLS